MLVAKSGKHCVMEKPISLNFLEAKKLTDAFDKSAGILFPVLQVRYNPAVITVKKFIDDGMFGRIHTAVLSIHWTRPQEYFDESNWKGRKKLDGGSLLTQAIHYIDVLQYVLGGVRSIYAKIDTVAHNIEVEDIANAILDLKSGARVNFDFTICTYPQNMECSLTILGEKGTVKIGGLAMNKVEYWDVKDTPVPNIPEGLPPNIYAGGAYVGSCPNHQAIYGNVVDVIIRGKENHIEGKDALESLKIIDGIVASSITKKEIVL
jgi:UDP-N-acetyl-2-amino-2-deoxyglucuronate dehydrogenase